MKKILLFTLTIATLSTVSAQEKTDKFLVDLLKKQPEKFGKILANPAAYRVQILYTQINRDKNNVPHFKSYAYRLNKDEYFYPASTVKFPSTLLALEKLNSLKIKGLDRKTTMLSDSAYDGQIRQLEDSTNLENFKPTIEHYVKKILVVSDNDAFNRLFEFMGQEAFNETLRRKGFADVRITHRLSVGMTREQNRRSNPVSFVGKMGEKLYEQPVLVSTKMYEPKAVVKLGKGYMTAGKTIYVGDSLVKEPFDFTHKNSFPIENQQAILKTMLFPEAVKAEQRFNLTPEDYKFLYQYMSQYPTETRSPPYASDTSMTDSYCKFLMFGDSKKPIPKNIRIFNKVGDAYGFLIDNAYVVDFEKGVEFMLTATIYCNEDGIFNDDHYDYDDFGFPFMANLGKTIYDFELSRKRKVKPDLSKFKLKYDN